MKTWIRKHSLLTINITTLGAWAIGLFAVSNASKFLDIIKIDSGIILWSFLAIVAISNLAWLKAKYGLATQHRGRRE